MDRKPRVQIMGAFPNHVPPRNVRPFIHCNYRGKKLVAVGEELHFSDQWKTPGDFLFDYIKHVLTPAWGKAELAKPFEDRHPILRWYDRTCRFQAKQTKGPDGIYKVKPSAAMRAYMALAYDLYTLKHHSLLQKSLVERLKKLDQYQGARNELFAAATCIRAGFEIEYEDERDRTRKHTEFVAVHRRTGQKINVEAKSRHRKGVLGQPGERSSEKQVRVRIKHLINDALSKPTKYPYVIFIDLNLPPSSPAMFTDGWFKEVVGPILTDDSGTPRDSDPWNLLVLTNYPDHYVEDDLSAPDGYSAGIFGRNPPRTPEHPQSIQEVYFAALELGDIPRNFD